MQAALRLARHRATIPAARRCLATTANPAADVASSAPAATSSRSTAAIPLSNVEAQWAKLDADEKTSVHDQLEVLQKKNWKELSIDEKKAAYYVAFGPHGPRTPVSQPGELFKVFLGTTALVGVAFGLFVSFKSFAAPPPKTRTKEWEEATNERALELKLNPITGISSEGYKGKGFVVSK